MCCKGDSLHILHIEYDNGQLPRRRNPGVQLPEGSRSGIARIGKKSLSVLLSVLIQPSKHRAGHKYLPADNQVRDRLGQLQRNGADRLEVSRHVLPHPAVPAGGAPDKGAVYILQCYRQPVYLRLHVIFRLRHRAPDPLVKLGQLPQIKHILETLQRNLVGDWLKALLHLSSDSLRGRIRSHKLGMRGLQLLQPAELMVIVIIAHGGVVHHIILIAGLIQHCTQPFDLRFCIHSGILLFWHRNRAVKRGPIAAEAGKPSNRTVRPNDSG